MVIWKAGLQRRSVVFPPACSLPKWLQQPKRAGLKPGVWGFLQVSLLGAESEHLGHPLLLFQAH